LSEIDLSWRLIVGLDMSGKRSKAVEADNSQIEEGFIGWTEMSGCPRCRYRLRDRVI
jgi:hypothetical protein